MSSAPPLALVPQAREVTAEDVQFIADAAQTLLLLAEERGLCLSIERQSVPPLAMGRHRAAISIWPLRS